MQSFCGGEYTFMICLDQISTRTFSGMYTRFCVPAMVTTAGNLCVTAAGNICNRMFHCYRCCRRWLCLCIHFGLLLLMVVPSLLRLNPVNSPLSVLMRPASPLTRLSYRSLLRLKDSFWCSLVISSHVVVVVVVADHCCGSKALSGALLI